MSTKGVSCIIDVSVYLVGVCIFFFFFQAEDGIRDHCVTGVQRVLFRSLFKASFLGTVRLERETISKEKVCFPFGDDEEWKQIGRASCRERV